MTLSSIISKSQMAKAAGVALMALTCSVHLVAQGDTGCNLVPEIVLKNSVVPEGTPVAIKFLLSNDGAGSCRLLADLLPEGWVIRLFVRNEQGLLIYQSPVLKIEMTRAKIQNQVTIMKAHIHGAEFSLRDLQSGSYVVSGEFSTTYLATWKVEGLPIGVWEAPPVSFKIAKR